MTPKGRKDRQQLIGSFLITESRPVSFVPKWNYNLFYDAASPGSVLYTDSASPEKIDEVSDYFNRRFNATRPINRSRSRDRPDPETALATLGSTHAKGGNFAIKLARSSNLSKPFIVPIARRACQTQA